MSKRVITVFEEIGAITLFVGQILRDIVRGKFHMRLVFEQMVFLGINSLSITIITAIFVGMAFTVQIVKEFLRFGAGGMIGGIVGMAVWRELGPMMTGAVVAGRIGAAIAAELGTMKVTEQIEALKALSQDPVRYLVIPRVLALSLMMPLLVGIADIAGYFSGFLVATFAGNINPQSYFDSTQNMLTIIDITGGLFKGLLFGFVIAIIGSFMGLQTHSGAKGVGKSTRRAVVVSLISVFVLNYFLSVVVF